LEQDVVEKKVVIVHDVVPPKPKKLAKLKSEGVRKQPKPKKQKCGEETPKLPKPKKLKSEDSLSEKQQKTKKIKSVDTISKLPKLACIPAGKRPKKVIPLSTNLIFTDSSALQKQIINNDWNGSLQVKIATRLMKCD